MAKIPRKTQQIFASQSGESEKAQFGSMKTGSPVYSNDLEELQINPAYTQGWQEAIIDGKNPFLEEFNAINYINTSQLAYLFQQGIAEWDSATTYYINSLCQVGGNIYKSLVNDNVGNSPESENNIWASVDIYNLTDKDFSNVTATASALMAHNAMPASTWTELTLGASGATYTAPLDGYVYFNKVSTANGQSASINGVGYGIATNYVPNGQSCLLFLPVRKGATFGITYTLAGQLVRFAFLPAVGSEG